MRRAPPESPWGVTFALTLSPPPHLCECLFLILASCRATGVSPSPGAGPRASPSSQPDECSWLALLWLSVGGREDARYGYVHDTLAQFCVELPETCFKKYDWRISSKCKQKTKVFSPGSSAEIPSHDHIYTTGFRCQHRHRKAPWEEEAPLPVLEGLTGAQTENSHSDMNCRDDGQFQSTALESSVGTHAGAGFPTESTHSVWLGGL